MQHLQLFQPKQELTAVADTSARIVTAISENYREIIRRMVAKSDTTKTTYTRNVCHFIAYIQAHGIHAHTFGEYREQLAALDGIAVKTKNAYMAAAAALLRECLKYGILPVDITANVPGFKTTRSHVKDGLTPAEISAVSKHISGIKNAATRLKMAAMFNLMANEGLRQMEVQQLRADDVNLKDGFIRIRGKGKHDTEKFYIMAGTVAALREYMDAAGIASGWMFPAGDDPGHPVTLRAIRKFFTCPKYGIFARCGITGKSTHGFRHFNITQTLRATGGDMAKTRRRSRHAGFDMLVVYDDERLSKMDVAHLEQSFNAALIA